MVWFQGLKASVGSSAKTRGQPAPLHFEGAGPRQRRAGDGGEAAVAAQPFGVLDAHLRPGPHNSSPFHLNLCEPFCRVVVAENTRLIPRRTTGDQVDQLSWKVDECKALPGPPSSARRGPLWDT